MDQEKRVTARAGWTAVIGAVLITSIALAQSVDGTWTTSLRTRAPDRQLIKMTLTSDGGTVRGTIHASRPIPFEGSITGNTLNVTLKVPTVTGSEILVGYTGVLQGDEIRFTYLAEADRPSPPMGPNAREFTATRVR